jgi:hypothetical protein
MSEEHGETGSEISGAVDALGVLAKRLRTVGSTLSEKDGEALAAYDDLSVALDNIGALVKRLNTVIDLLIKSVELSEGIEGGLAPIINRYTLDINAAYSVRDNIDNAWMPLQKVEISARAILQAVEELRRK